MSADPSALLGRQLGGYEVLALLGAGGMGEVYRARDLKLGREVALKVLVGLAARDPGYLQRFETEAQLASVLNHPNIVTIYGVGQDADVPYIAMELVRGVTLSTRLANHPLGVGEVLDVVAQLADALAAAHANGIAHRDLKPDNVMVTPEGLVKVLDFGLAKRPRGLDASDPAHGDVATHAGLTREGVILGTVGYMSPEQAAGRPADLASDQFSFGVILYELLTGRAPFERRTSVETLSAIIRDDPPALESLNAAVTAPLQQIVERCLAKDPRARYADTRQLAVDVRHIRDRSSADGPPQTGRMLTEAAVTGAASASVSTRPRAVTRRRAFWLTGGVITTLAALGSAWQLWPTDTGIRVLAVLPFVNATNDEDTDYLCDGLTESLIQQISRLPSLTVMAQSTVFNFKGKPINPRDVGRQLGVDAVLTGAVSRRSGRLRITAELMDVATGAQLWGNTYDRDLTEVVSVQDEIANAIMDEGIRLKISGDDRRTLLRHPTDDPEAYELYLRGRHALLRGAEQDNLQAREFLARRAAARDPQFTLAHAALAAAYIGAAMDGFERPVEALPEARRALRRVIELDPQIPQAHSLAASVAFFFDWDWAEAQREWNLFMQAPPGALPTQELVGYSLARWALGDPNDALRLIRSVRRADPVSVSYAVWEADYLFHAGEFDAAAALYEKAITQEPTETAFLGLAEVRRAQGRFDEAIEARRRAHEGAEDDALRDVLSTARGAEGYQQIDRAAARQEVESLQTHAATAYVSPLDFARAHAKLGNRDQAFRYLDAAFADRAPGLVFLNADRAWDVIRGDSRFEAAVRRVGLP